MSYVPADLLATTTAVASDAARRLTSATAVKARLEISGSTYDTIIESLIDRVSEDIAAWCGAARDAIGSRPTFMRETLTATWYRGGASRGSRLRLPWRVPVTSVTSVVEDGVTLAAGTDYSQVSPKPGTLLRLVDGGAATWSGNAIVVVYVAGFATVPPEVESAAIEEVSYRFLSRKRDSTMRSEMVPDVYQASWDTAGGSARTGDSRLVPQVQSALSTYRDWGS